MAENIMNQRESTLQAVFSFISGIISEYHGTKLSCPSTAEFFQRYQRPFRTENHVYPSHRASRIACDSMVLGSLLKSLLKEGLWPPPISPYGHHTLDDICFSIQCLDMVSLCDQLQPPKNSSSGECHGLSAKIRDNVEEQRERISGFDLQNFKKAM
jgi:hypothetical protein